MRNLCACIYKYLLNNDKGEDDTKTSLQLTLAQEEEEEE